MSDGQTSTIVHPPPDAKSADASRATLVTARLAPASCALRRLILGPSGRVAATIVAPGRRGEDSPHPVGRRRPCPPSGPVGTVLLVRSPDVGDGSYVPEFGRGRFSTCEVRTPGTGTGSLSRANSDRGRASEPRGCFPRSSRAAPGPGDPRRPPYRPDVAKGVRDEGLKAFRPQNALNRCSPRATGGNSQGEHRSAVPINDAIGGLCR